jgi:hypothetical protein
MEQHTQSISFFPSFIVRREFSDTLLFLSICLGIEPAASIILLFPLLPPGFRHITTMPVPVLLPSVALKSCTHTDHLPLAVPYTWNLGDYNVAQINLIF